MATKLNSMRLLETHNIPYEAVEYPSDMRDAEQIAEVLGVPPHLVYKTLVIEAEGARKPALIMLAAHRTLDLKRMAAAMGVKKASMATHKDAEQLTGLQVGGISALMLVQKHWDVYLDQPATALEHILISAGQRGLDLRVPTAALVQVVHAKIADVSRD